MPLWRVVRQYGAIERAEIESAIQAAEASRVGQAVDKDYKRYMGGLRSVLSSARKQPSKDITKADARALGLKMEKQSGSVS